MGNSRGQTEQAQVTAFENQLQNNEARPTFHAPNQNDREHNEMECGTARNREDETNQTSSIEQLHEDDVTQNINGEGPE